MTVKQVKNTMTASLARIEKALDTLPRQAYDFWVAATPKRTGNARRRTKLRGDTIDAAYDYAVPLDQGWSKQAPDGMSRPTEQFIQRTTKKILRK